MSSIVTSSGNDCDERTDDEEDGKSNSSGGSALLWKTILEHISGSSSATNKLTHLAINEGIPLHSKQKRRDREKEIGTETEARAETTGTTRVNCENILRSPSGLRMLYGDFGPSEPSPPSLSPSSTPTGGEGGRESERKREEADFFSRAFWVSTKQNGITQTWAPRWTMFSRGNIKEKARLLSFHDDNDDNNEDKDDDDDQATIVVKENATQRPVMTDSQEEKRNHEYQDQRNNNRRAHRVVPAERRADGLVVDLYAGIGYFAFCYAALGFRVLCWELNAWSVEGLRRGAEANGWGVRVVVPERWGRRRRRESVRRGDAEEEEEVVVERVEDNNREKEEEKGEEEEEKEEEEEEEMLRDVLTGDEKIIVFLEDNKHAARRIRKLDELTREQEQDRNRNGLRGLRMRDVMHVNCGLLPSSRGSWDTAWEIASRTPRAWVHVHENVGVADIEAKKEDVGRWFKERAGDDDGDDDGDGDGDGRRTRLCVEHVEMVKTFAPGVWHCVFDLCIRRDVDGVDHNIP